MITGTSFTERQDNLEPNIIWLCFQHPNNPTAVYCEVPSEKTASNTQKQFLVDQYVTRCGNTDDQLPPPNWTV